MAMRRVRATVLLVALLAVVGDAPAWAADAVLGAGPRLTKRLTSLKELRARHVVFQEYDFSCGAAAIATLLNYWFGEPVTEKEIILGIAERADVQKVLKRRAFSLLDMKRFAEARGYKATGYRMDLEFLVGLDQPVILPVTIRGYKHFVVFKGLVGDRAVIADPAFGNYTMRASRFMSIWPTSIGFVLERDTPSGPLTREDLERRALFMPPHRLSVVATGTAPSFVPIAGKVQSVTGPRPVGGNLLDFLHITIPR